MITHLLQRRANMAPELLSSKIFDETEFYEIFIKDLSNCNSEAIIESPFLTQRRVNLLLPTLRKLKSRRVRVVVNTRCPSEQDSPLKEQPLHAMSALLSIGVQVIYTEGHHRKLAILDRKILYEGSLNILSQNNSREVMRRIESVQLAWQMIGFIELDKLIN